MKDSRTYETQLVELLRSIGKTLGSAGVSPTGGGASSYSSSDNLSDVVAAVNRIAAKLDTAESYLNILTNRVQYDPQSSAFHVFGNIYADGFVSAGGVGSGGGGGGGSVDLDRVWQSLTNNTDKPNVKINAAHLVTTDRNDPVGLIIGDNLTYDPVTRILAGTSGITSVAGLTGPVITSAALVSALGLSSAFKYRGTTTTDIETYPSSNPIYINGDPYTASAGDVVVLYGTSTEYLFNGSTWQAIGDESSYALKTVSITGTGYLTGGGTLEQSRTIDITQDVKVKIEHGESAYNRTNWDLYLEIDANGDIHVKGNRGLWTDSFVTAGGVGSGGGGGGGDLDVNTMYINLANGEGAIPLYFTREINVSHLHEFWKSLQNNDIVSTYDNYKIAGSHIPDMAETYGYLKSADIDAYLQSLQSQVDSVASRNAWDEIVATVVDADVVAATTGYFTSLYGELTGNAATATKLAASKTLWGQPFDGSANVSGNMSSVGNISMNGSISGATTISASTSITAPRFYLNSTTYFELDSSGYVHLVHPSGKGFYADGFITAGGVGSGGGGGVDLDRVWASLTNSIADSHANDKIAAAHFPLGSGLTIDGEGNIALDSVGSVTSVAMTVPTGLSVAGSPITSYGTLAVTFAVGYSIPLTSDTAKGVTAYGWGDVISDCLQSLQSQIDSVATRNDFDEINASSVFSDIVAATSLYVGSIALGGNDLATTLSNLSGRIGTVEGKFTGDSANSALRLAGTSAYSIWGVEYWSSGVPKSVTGRPGLFIGSTQVQTASATQDLAGIGSITATGALTLSSTKKIYFGDSTHYIELDTDGYFHFSHGLYSDSFVTAGGVGSGGGGGVDLDRVWQSLTNEVADTHANDKIADAHIPDMADVYGYLKGNQTITLTGVVTGSGATSIVTSIANNALSIAMVNGLQDALDSKTGNVGTVTSVGLSMPTEFSVASSPITSSGTLAVSFASGYSLPTTAKQSNWDTAYGWGNHATAGYFAVSSFTASNIVSTLGNTAVNRATADTAGENIANNFTTVGSALKSLQSQIDSVASRSVYDELTATNLYSDMAVGVSAYFSNFYGNLTGTASNATNADNADKLDGVHASGLFTELTTSAGSTNLYITIGGTRLSKTVYAYYDSDGGIIASNMTTVGTALKSLQSQIDSVAANRAFDELTVTAGYFDMLSVGANLNVAGTIYSIKGIYSSGYVTAGAVGSSSDARLKNDIETISAKRAADVIMALRPCEWVWNEKHSSLEGRSSAGLIAQEVSDILPDMVYEVDGELSLLHNVLHGYQISMLQDHETRIEALERENKELKHKIEILTNNS